MWLGIVNAVAGLLGGPFATAAVNAYKAKLSSENSADQIAATLAARELQLQQREIEVQAQLRAAEIGKWYEPAHLFAYVMVIYFAKVVVWDKVLGSLTHSSTDPLTGDVATWAGMIFAFYLGKRGFENVAAILKRK